MSHATLRVPDMSCEACQTTVERTLKGLPGVADVSVDLELGLVSVEHDEALLPLPSLTAALEQQGYPVTAAAPL